MLGARSHLASVTFFLTALITACNSTTPRHTLTDASTDTFVDSSDTLTDAIIGISDTHTDVSTDLPDVLLDPIEATAPFVRYVDPLIGTGGDGFGTGSAFPGPQRPFGLARPGPDTSTATGDAVSFAHCAGYAFIDSHIAGFSQLHMHGTGIVDYGAIGFMPTLTMTAEKTTQRGYLSRFSHSRETVEPGYYRVVFDGSNITTELTATDHVALYRVTFAQNTDGVLIFDLGHTLPGVRISAASITVDTPRNELYGRVRFLGGYSDRFGGVEAHWVARLSRPLTRAGTFTHGTLTPDTDTQTGTTVGAYVPIDTSRETTVTVAIGLSLTDLDHARANLAAESPSLDFDAARSASVAQWEALLSRVKITARGEHALKTYYTAVYHTLLMPTRVSDTDGTYRGVDGQLHHTDGWNYYSDLSLWDTFRTEHPWLTLVYPEYQRDFVRSIVAMAEALGYFPRWPLGTGETGGMVGDCGALMVADTWLRGLRDFDVDTAWSIANRSAHETPSRREGLSEYLSNGYVSIDNTSSSASSTLEYAYADGALAAMARGLGHTDDAQWFASHALNYRNLYDPAQGYFLGRHRDGTFAMLDRAINWQDYFAEGNAWQYLWYAPHDLDGLSTLMGGRDTLLSRLDDFFTRSMNTRRNILPDPYYWHGNEPDLHAAFIPSHFDDLATASRYVNWVRTTRYDTSPGGLPGNDDAGTLSAWYTLAALGMFPLAGTDQWLLAAPSVTRAEVSLGTTQTINITAPNVTTSPRATWNGTILPRPRLSHSQLAHGGTLLFE